MIGSIRPRSAVSYWALALSCSLLLACGGTEDGPPVDSGTPGEDSGTVPGEDGGTSPGEDSGTTPGDDGGTSPGDDAGMMMGDDSGAECPLGYAGADCMECAPGYSDDETPRVCVPGCDATGPDAFTCGVGSECQISPLDGSRICACLDGYEGDMCDVCSDGWTSSRGMCQLISPPALGLMLWLDGDEAGSVDVDSSMHVTDWRDRRGLGGLSASPTTGIARPLFRPTGRNGRGAIEFDGMNDQMTVNGFTGLGSTDFEVIIAAEPAGDTPTGLFGALTGTAGWAFMIERHASRDFRAIYRQTPGTSGGDTINLMRTAPSRPMYISASHATSSAVDTLAMFASDDPDDAFNLVDVTPSVAAPNPVNLRIGRTQNGRMTGKIYEVLVYARRLSVADRRAVFLYLSEKWNLP